eukprot:7376844-Pyramimonas_sp.AAC.1
MCVPQRSATGVSRKNVNGMQDFNNAVNRYKAMGKAKDKASQVAAPRGPVVEVKAASAVKVRP